MQNVNEFFAEFAACFAGSVKADDGDIMLPQHLDRPRLNLSVESLKAVDAYLARLHPRAEEIPRDKFIRVVLWGGAYVGEVISRNAVRTYNWIDFDEYIKFHPDDKQLLGEEAQLETRALLVHDDGFILPLNKVVKFLFDGPEDSVWFFAHAELQHNP